LAQTEDAAPPAGEFTSLAEPFRRELLAHCYRMLGSVDDAEDMVQETLLRAWRSFDSFAGRSSLRTWLYRIATNVCLSALQHRSRRVLPSGLGAPGHDPGQAPIETLDGPWLQPIPDVLLTGDPAEVVAARDGLRLALVASLQYLPARQRAVLILRDVLAFAAHEVAEMLDTTTAAVKSALQRARATLEQLAPAPETVAEPTEPELRALVEEYIAAFENADAAALERLLRKDVALEAPPLRNWFSGLRFCMPFMATHVLGSPGHWRMLPTRANGQPAVAAYTREGDLYHAYGIVVLTATTTGIARITAFGEPGLLTHLGLAATMVS
jgi:RNA polymerase sigma-70 factor, ECF subfamily